MWIWGGTSRGKLGINHLGKDQLDPLYIEYEVVINKNNDDTENIVLEPFFDENKKHRKFNTEYIEEF